MGNALKTVLNKSANDVADMMNKAGYGASIIISALSDAFGIARNVIDGILSALGIN